MGKVAIKRMVLYLRTTNKAALPPAVPEKVEMKYVPAVIPPPPREFFCQREELNSSQVSCLKSAEMKGYSSALPAMPSADFNMP